MQFEDSSQFYRLNSSNPIIKVLKRGTSLPDFSLRCDVWPLERWERNVHHYNCKRSHKDTANTLHHFILTEITSSQGCVIVFRKVVKGYFSLLKYYCENKTFRPLKKKHGFIGAHSFRCSTCTCKWFCEMSDFTGSNLFLFFFILSESTHNTKSQSNTMAT